MSKAITAEQMLDMVSKVEEFLCDIVKGVGDPYLVSHIKAAARKSDRAVPLSTTIEMLEKTMQVLRAFTSRDLRMKLTAREWELLKRISNLNVSVPDAVADHCIKTQYEIDNGSKTRFQITNEVKSLQMLISVHLGEEDAINEPF